MKKLSGYFRRHELIDGEWVLKGEYKNDTTDLMKGIELSGGVTNITAAMSGSYASLVQQYGNLFSQSSNYSRLNGVTMYLCNLTAEEKKALSEHSLILPLYNVDGTVNSDKIVGYANTITTSNAKAGSVVPPHEEDYLDTYRTSVGFKWLQEKAVGTYNTVLIGADIISSQAFNGLTVMKGVENKNSIYGTDTAPIGRFIRPGVTNVTGEYEILVAGIDSGTTAKRILNLKSGVYTDIPTDSPLYGIKLPHGAFSQIVADGYLFYVDKDLYINYINLETLAVTTATTKVNSESYNTFCYNPSDKTILYCYSTSGLRKFSTQSLTSTTSSINLSSLSLPAGVNTSLGSVVLMNFGAEFLLLDKSGVTFANSPTGPKIYTFSDLSSISTSITGVQPFALYSGYYSMGGQLYGMGYNLIDSDYNLADSPLYYRQINIQGSLKDFVVGGNQLWVSKLWGNLLSYAFITDSNGVETEIVNDGSNAFTYSYAWKYEDLDEPEV